MFRIDLNAAVEFYKIINELVNKCKGSEIGNTFAQMKKWIKTIFPDIEDYLDKGSELEIYGEIDLEFAKTEYIYQQEELEKYLDDDSDYIGSRINENIVQVLEDIFPLFPYFNVHSNQDSSNDESDNQVTSNKSN